MLCCYCFINKFVTGLMCFPMMGVLVQQMRLHVQRQKLTRSSSTSVGGKTAEQRGVKFEGLFVFHHMAPAV